MRRRGRQILLCSLVMGVLLGFLASGAWRPAPRHEPVQAGSSADPPATENGQVQDVPPRKPFIFLPLPRQTPEVKSVLPAPQPATEEDMGEILRQAQDRDLTLREQLAVLRIAYTRLSSEERGRLLKLFREGATMEEALDAYRLLRERLTEEELVLTLSLMRRYRDELQQLIRK